MADPSSPSSPPPPPPPPFESFLVRALHAFSPTTLTVSATSTTNPIQSCLAFNQGDLIRCFSKDPSGWWDGQLVLLDLGDPSTRVTAPPEGESLVGMRGWFPSNYVEVITEPKRGVLPTARLPRDSQTLLDKIDHNVAVLEAAIRVSKKNLYQPSTAHVISSIRTVLSSTSCLTRDSPVLKRHPALSSARKKILSSLAQLVNAARTASAPAAVDPPDPVQELRDAKELVRIARETVGLVRIFLERAGVEGVEVDLTRGNELTPVLGHQGSWNGSGSEGSPLLGAGAGAGASASPRTPTLRGAKSLGDMLRSPSSSSPHPDATPRASNGGARSPVRSRPSSPAHTRTGSSASSSEVRLSSPTAVASHLSTLHDALLSTLAALIGHIHAHSRSTSPATSFARLIDLTREAIERVRDLLVVVERVGDAALAGSEAVSTVDEVKTLAQDREALYQATTALVTAAREATAPLPEVTDAANRDEVERSGLLGATTAVLRSGGDCVSAVERVVQQYDASSKLDLVLPRSRTAEQLAADPRAAETASHAERDGEHEAGAHSAEMTPATSVDTLRGFGHGRKRSSSTLLNLLGKKAASLSALKERYAADEQNLTTALGGLEVADGERNDAEAESAKSGVLVGPPSASPLSTSPTETVVSPTSLAPAIPVVGAPSRNSSSAHSKRGSATSMMRQQSTESAHSQTSSHVTNLSLASSAALTHRTDDTSPRTSLAAQHSPSGGTLSKRMSASSVSTRPPSRQEAGLTSLAIPARLSSNSLMRDAPMASPSLPFNYALPAPSTLSLVASPLSTTAPSSALSPQTTHTSGAASSTTSGGSWFLERDYEPREISFNADGHVSGGTLRCLVERMTLHDTTIDAAFSNTFLLTFRMFTSPLELARRLWARFDLPVPVHPQTGAALSPEELKKWTSQKLTPIRLRVYNLFKTWIEQYWLYEHDREMVDELLEWCQGRLREALPAPSKRLTELVNKRVNAGMGRRSSTQSEFGMRLGNASDASLNPSMNGSVLSLARAPAAPTAPSSSTSGSGRGFLNRMQSMDRLRHGSISSVSASTPLPTADIYSPAAAQATNAPPPIISKSLIAALRPTLSGRSPLLTSVVEIEPLELARQLTIMESRIYCSIRPDELLSAATASSNSDTASRSSAGEGLPKAQNVRKMSALSTKLTGWIAETILNEHDQKRRTGLVKFFVKLGERLLELGNYNALFAVFTALSSSTISRLQKTWDGLAPKYKSAFGSLRKATDHARNYAEYRQKIRQALPPCLPFVGLFLTDLIFVYEGNRAERVSPADPELSLINFDRYHKMARVVGELQRFQSPYALVEVPELQSYLAYELDTLKNGQDAQSLYRQSLMIEPRQGGAASSSAASIVSSNSGHHPGRDLFNWRG